MGSAEDAVKEKLLWNVKKEVKSGQGPPGVSGLCPRGPGGGKVRAHPRAGACWPRPGPGGGGVLDWLRLLLLSRIRGQHPSARGGSWPVLRVLFAPGSRSSPPCDGSSAGRPRSGEGWRRFLESQSCPFIAGAAWGGGGAQRGSPRAAEWVISGLSSGLSYTPLCYPSGK